MAKDDQDLELDVEEEGKGGKGKLIIIAAVVLIGGGAAAFFLMGGEEEAAPAAEGEAAVAAESSAPKEPAQYVGVPQDLTSNIPGEKRNRTVQIKVAFMVRSDEAVDAVKLHMPRLRSEMLILVSQQTVESMQSPEGRVALQQASLERLQEILSELTGKPMIEKVLFVRFLMQ